MSRGFARDLAAVFEFPRRASEMTSDNLAFFIFQLCRGRCEGPSELTVRAALAGIDLRSGSMREQDKFCAGRSLNRRRDAGRRRFLCVG